MSMTVDESLTMSMRYVKTCLMPSLEKVLDGWLMPVEGNTMDKTKKLLDTLAGIDMFCINPDKGMRGIASRVQPGKCWRTFTVRAVRESGAKTEYEKRKYAIENGYLYPAITYQAYIDEQANEAVVGFAYTKDIIACIDMGVYILRHTGQDQKGQAAFYVIKWDDMRTLGMRVKEIMVRDLF